jgi:WD40 repeat protein
MAYNPKDGQLAVACEDRHVRIYDANGWLTRILVGHLARVDEVAWSPDGKLLASGSDDKTIRLWDGVTFRPLRTLKEHHGNVHNLAWSPDGKSLASATEPGGELFLWKVGKDRPVQTLLNGHPGEIRGFSWSPDGKTLVSANLAEKRVRFWDVHTGKEQPSSKQADMPGPHYPAWSPKGDMVAVRTAANEIRILEPDGKLVRQLSGQVARQALGGNVLWKDSTWLLVGI